MIKSGGMFRLYKSQIIQVVSLNGREIVANSKAFSILQEAWKKVMESDVLSL
jgi:hypothetical protein